MPGQGSKMRFDFDATGDLPQATSWRGMFAWANNTKTAYVSSGTTMGGYNGWRKLLHQDHEGNYFTVGVITASKFAGDGSELTNLPSTDSIWRTNSTGIHTLSNVGLGTTNTEGYKLNVLGNLRLQGRLDGTATDNILPHLWAQYSSLPSPTTYHGQFAHAHDTGKAYFAHAGAWMELVNKNTDTTVGTGTENYRVGVLTATSFTGDGSGLSNIAVSYAASSGIATLAQGLDGKPDILVANINCTGITTSATFVGDGSGLTGITASGSGIIIREDGTLVGTIGTVNFGTGFDVSPASAGVVTVTTSGGGGGGISGIVYQEEGSTVGTAQTVNFIGSACTVTHSGGVATVNLAGAVPFTGPAANITALDITQYEAAYGWGDHSGAGYLTGIGGQNLGSLNNVSSASPSTSDVLTWSGSQWAPAAPTGGSGIIIKEEGSQVAAGITSLNFVGSTVSATASGTDGTITITAGGGGGGSISTTGVGTYTASAGVEQQVDSWSKLSYSGAEYTFMIGLGTFRQSQKVLVMHDGTTAFSQEYGIMFSPEQQVSIAATVSSNNVLVKVTPEAGISGLSTYRFVKTFIENL